MLTVHALAAFTLALLAPSALIALAPLVLGVPHLAADVRHLLIRRAAPRWWLLASAGFAVVLVAMRALAQAGPPFVPSLAVEQGVASTWVLLGAAAGTRTAAARRARGLDVSPSARTRSAREWGALAAAAAVAAAAIGAPRLFRMLLLHGHNLIAVFIWVLFFRREWRVVWLPVALVLVGGGVLASGALLSVTLEHGALSVVGLHLFAASDWLAPGLRDQAAMALTISFAFLQSVHYAIWLIGIPAGDRPGEGGRSWRVAWRELVRDLRPGGVAFVIGLAVLVALSGLLHIASAHRLYLTIGTFHGWLELAVLAYLLARGRVQETEPTP